MIFLPSFLFPWPDVNWGPWIILAATGVAIAAWKVPHPFRWLVAYMGMQAVYFGFVAPYNPALPIEQSLGQQATAAVALICFMAFFQFRRDLKHLETAIIFCGAIEAICMLFRFPGFMGNTSIAATFLVLWIFACLHRQLFGLAILGIISVAISDSSISLLAMCIGLAVAAPIPWWQKLVLPVIGIVVAFMQDATNQRFKIWPMFIEHWNSKFNMWFGSGLGSFQLHSTQIPEVRLALNGRIWPWAHSDWLEIWLETGWIGLVFAIFAICWLFIKCKDWTLRGAIASTVILMFGNYPLQVVPSALIIYFLGVKSYERAGRDQEIFIPT